MSKIMDVEGITEAIRATKTKLALQAVFGGNMRENAAAAGALNAVEELLDLIPGVDAVEVVRCKDCIHTEKTEYEIWCTGRGFPKQLVSIAGYCDKGDRKNGNQ